MALQSHIPRTESLRPRNQISRKSRKNYSYTTDDLENADTGFSTNIGMLTIMKNK